MAANGLGVAQVPELVLDVVLVTGGGAVVVDDVVVVVLAGGVMPGASHPPL